MKQLHVAKTAGFCFGVKRSVDLAEEMLATHESCYSFGHLIHNDDMVQRLEQQGLRIVESDEGLHEGDAVIVRRTGKLRRTNIKTLPYPGFPTDMQPQVAAVLCLAEGTSMLTEGIWDNRYRYVDEFRRLGAKITVDGKVAVIEGVKQLTGAPMSACDLRAGAAMIVAGLAANGVTEIDQVHYIERGYQNIVEKLAKLGADIHEETIKNPDEDWRSSAG